MIDRVEDYLAQLKKALVGADPATVQDALADSEDHLRTGVAQLRASKPELSEPVAVQQMIEAYGSPEEVAAGYREVEARVLPPLEPRVPSEGRSGAARFFGVFFDPRAYAALFYMLFSMIGGIVYFTWAVTGLSLAAGLIITIVGLPFFALFLLSVQGITLVEGRLIEVLLGVRMPRRPLFSHKHLGVWGRFKALFTDSRSWLTILYMVIQMPLGILYFTLFITLISIGIGLIATPVLHYAFDLPVAHIGHVDYFAPWWALPLLVLGGAMLILVTMHLAKFVGRLHGGYAKALLVRE